MKITFENPDKINGQMTLVVEEADYKENVEKQLKDYRKKANVPGFRPGQAPMGMIKRQFGTAVKVDVINKLIGEEMYKYIQDNKIQMLGEPLPSDKQEQQDLEAAGPYTFVFDIAVAPELKTKLTKKDKIEYYNIEVDDKLVNDQVDMFASRAGHYDKVETYDAEQNDMLKGDLRELDANGNAKEDGVVVEGAVLMPKYIKVEDQKKLFEGAKVGSVITFNPKQAYEGNEAEISSLLKIDREKVAEMDSNFTYLVTEISRYVKAEVNQELFDSVYGKDEVKSEEEFRNKIAEGLKEQLKLNSDYKFLLDVRAHCEKKNENAVYPDALLKKIMKLNNPYKDDEFVEKNYDQSIKELTWHLVKEALVGQTKIKIEDADVKEAAKETARMQFAQYGMSNVPEEYLDNYVQELLKKKESVNQFVDRAIDVKLTAALKDVVAIEEKTISLDDFNKMMGE